MKASLNQTINFPGDFCPHINFLNINQRIKKLINKKYCSTMSDVQETFQTGNAGSSDCIPCQAGSIKKGGYMMIKGFPCKVMEFSTAKPGKHGASKATIVGVDIFTNKKYQDTCPTSAGVLVPNVSKNQYEVADIDQEKFVSVILANGDLKSDLKLPEDDEETYKELRKCWDQNHGKNSVYFTLQAAIGKEKFISGRVKFETD